MKDSAQTLAVGTEENQIAWFLDFDQWQRSRFWDDIHAAAQSLSESSEVEAATLGSKALAIVDSTGGTPAPRTFDSLSAIAGEIRALADSMRKGTSDKIRGALNLQINQDKQFLDDMVAVIAGLDESDEFDEQDGEEEEEERQPRIGRSGAVAYFARAVRAQARAKARKRSIRRETGTGRLLEWLGNRTLSEQELAEVGNSLVVQSSLRALANPVRRYVDGAPSRYRRYRRIRKNEGRWYESEGFSSTDVHPFEVDIMLLAMLRNSDELNTGPRSLLRTDSPANITLSRMDDLYRTQIMVDEATDFSPVQLACMATLARPDTRSFFACGDFNQRVTNWGTRSIDEMKWVFPDVEIKSVAIAYRQSRQLHSLARRLVELSGGSEGYAVLPEFVENEGLPPTLALNMIDTKEVASWLAARVIEIEEFVGSLPSIAVLVNGEDEVRQLAQLLGEALLDNNISVEACSDGKVRGREGAVRVFNVQHIKGLEFEAVFFVGIDELAKVCPDLFDKYLYVGATRAATYLGLTCAGSLPPAMASLEAAFEKDWSNKAVGRR